MLRLNQDGDDLNSYNVMKNMNLKPWMIQGDDDIFAPREKVNTIVAIISSLIFKVEHTISKRKEKLVVK